ncbi:RidA family protein [Hypericibacter adhaerens]|uniref:RidA family protein n=1 Tax=Hypericibacter adhaerens TaxID=2602016 RepID=UPI001CDA519B|nr:RidA family protein [Hypericibacter adhaerens]
MDTGLPAIAGRPIQWATIADGILYTAQLPLRADGSFETGDIGLQTALTLSNLRRTVEAAGGTLADVTQVLVYLPDARDFAGMNAVYGPYFSEPYPNRAVFITGLVVPGARIEIVAYAHIGRAVRPAGRATPKAGAAAKRHRNAAKDKTPGRRRR